MKFVIFFVALSRTLFVGLDAIEKFLFNTTPTVLGAHCCPHGKWAFFFLVLLKVVYHSFILLFRISLFLNIFFSGRFPNLLTSYAKKVFRKLYLPSTGLLSQDILFLFHVLRILLSSSNATIISSIPFLEWSFK